MVRIITICILLFSIMDSPREPFNETFGIIFYVKDILLIGLLLFLSYGILNGKYYFLYDERAHTLENVFVYCMLFLFVYYLVVGILNGMNWNFYTITRSIKKFYFFVFLYWTTNTILLQSLETRKLILRFVLHSTIVVGFASVLLFIYGDFIPFYDSQKVALGRFITGQPSITSMPAICCILLMLSGHIKFRLIYFTLLNIIVLLSVSGTGLVSLACIYLIKIFYSRNIVLLGFIAFVALLIVTAINNSDQVLNENLSWALHLVKIKFWHVLGIMPDPSMSLRDQNYFIVREHLHETYLGHGNLVWLNYISWIENTYRVLHLEAGILGLILYLLFLFAVTGLFRNWSFYNVSLFTLMAMFSFTLDIFHVFTLSIIFAFMVRLRSE